jgi:hypothetical protein
MTPTSPMPSAEQAIEIFSTASEENLLSKLRQEQVVYLPADVEGEQPGDVWMTGDIHDHQRNFDKLLHAADLPNNPQRHLILHELIHGDRFDGKGAEGSCPFPTGQSRSGSDSR